MQGIVTRFHGPAGKRGARISATAECGVKVYVDRDDTLNWTNGDSHVPAVRKLCAKQGWHGELVRARISKPPGWAWVWVKGERITV